MSSVEGAGVAAEPPGSVSPAIQLLWSSQVVVPAGGSPGGGGGQRSVRDSFDQFLLMRMLARSSTSTVGIAQMHCQLHPIACFACSASVSPVVHQMLQQSGP
jgi:hypothetical protein